MTNEEAKGRLESFIDTFNICKEHDNSLVDVSIGKEDVQAFTQAIKTLEQQPCEDCISRQAVNDGFKKYENSSFAYGCVWDYINKLPPVTPKEKTGHWAKDKEIENE